ncbi:hypothetical protein KAK07_10155 [Ideonella sp. 4Y16]|uniref:RNA polymerase alpha subunit C-terminal domain-containing protein n=1 Tax=Ideonella alba TaxID=2824118 RepID=A0A941BMF1_9BURK|nr:DNA-directed RNA polymerase subunit alpha C-terminal domain-containing protein [Ideonella alba]MBQ0932194.1 hypothetical protein [Ideonella alba]MBQ0943699.1 hypothetical protein [Ideonella alba]
MNGPLGRLEAQRGSVTTEAVVASGLGLTLGGWMAAHLRQQPGVRAVLPRVRPAPAGRSGQGERLTLQVDADAGTDPRATLARVARQLRAVCVSFAPEAAAPPPPPPERPRLRGSLAWPLDALGLSLRCELALRRAGIEQLGALAALDERQLLALPHLGRRQVAEVVDMLAAHGLQPGTPLPG